MLHAYGVHHSGALSIATHVLRSQCAVCCMPKSTCVHSVSKPRLLYCSMPCLARQSFLIRQAAVTCCLACPHALPAEIDGTEVLPAHG